MKKRLNLAIVALVFVVTMSPTQAAPLPELVVATGTVAEMTVGTRINKLARMDVIATHPELRVRMVDGKEFVNCYHATEYVLGEYPDVWDVISALFYADLFGMIGLHPSKPAYWASTESMDLSVSERLKLFAKGLYYEVASKIAFPAPPHNNAVHERVKILQDALTTAAVKGLPVRLMKLGSFENIECFEAVTICFSGNCDP